MKRSIRRENGELCMHLRSATLSKSNKSLCRTHLMKRCAQKCANANGEKFHCSSLICVPYIAARYVSADC